MTDNYFAELNAVNVNGHTEKKNGLTYLSWAWAWGEVKKRFPDATYTIYENANGWFYHTDGKTCWVKTGVTVAGVEHIEYLPVMDYKNKSIPADSVDSFAVNTAIQRSLTKACARHGLGLYIYAGEDLPEEKPTANISITTPGAFTTADERPYPLIPCDNCGKEIKPARNSKGEIVSVLKIAEETNKRFGKTLCAECAKQEKANE